MKWGRKNSSSSGLSSLTQVFPISWLSKFKQMNSKPKSQHTKTKQKNKPTSPSLPVSFRDPRRYNGDVDGDDDAYWRLSFGEESVEGKKNRGVLRSVWYDSDDELEFPLSSYRSGRSTTRKVVAKEDTQKFSDMVSDIRKMRELGDKDREETGVSETPQKKIQKGRKDTNQKSRKKDRRILQEVCSDSGRESIKVSQRTSTEPEEKRFLDLEPVTTFQTSENDYQSFKALDSRKSHYISSLNSRITEQRGTIEEEDHELAAMNSKISDQSLEEEEDDDDEEEEEEEEDEGADSERKTVKKSKIKDLLLQNEKQRKSLYWNRELQKRRAKKSCKVRVYSPRTASKIEICKIRALEDMKKAKNKKKGRTVEGRPALESFAVVKCSFDPQKDFRDSMVEMIAENRIRQPEELENLLACYLSLNSDEYHDLIIKAFRQVWFDLDQSCFDSKLQNDDHSYNDY